MEYKSFSQTSRQRDEGDKSLTHWLLGGIWLAGLIFLFLYLSLQTLGAHRLHAKVDGALVNNEATQIVSVRDLRKFYNGRQIIDRKHSKLEERYVQKEKDLESKVLNTPDSRYQIYCGFLNTVLAGKVDQHVSLRELYDDSTLLTLIPGGKISESKILGHRASYLQEIRTQEIHLEPDVSCSEQLEFPLDYEIEWGKGVPAILGEYEYYHLNLSSDTWLNGFVKLIGMDDLMFKPRDILTMLLVVFMGILGAAIRVANGYMDIEDKQKKAHYFFIPLIGGATGFALFITAKAGVLLLTQYGVQDSEASLSPYLVSFLGLSAGLASNEALDSITAIGRRLFRQSAQNIHRWYIGSKGASATEEDISKMANTLQVPNDKVKKWLSTEEAAPDHAQDVITIQLEEDKHKAFTDIKPFNAPSSKQS